MSAVENINDKLDKLNGHFERHEKLRDQIEKSAASVIAELTIQNQKILRILENVETHIITCECNRELIEILKQERSVTIPPIEEPTEDVQQSEEMDSKTELVKINMKRTGWYPENLNLGKNFVFKSMRYE